MDTTTRKAAISAYKERKDRAGIFAVRCAATDDVWVGQCADLDAIANRIWFELKQGGNRNSALQSAYAKHGSDRFSLEVLERLSDEDLQFTRQALLKARAEHWRSVLGARPI